MLVHTQLKGRERVRRFGAAAVEFAVLAPFLGMLVVAINELGRGIHCKEIITDAARSACRTAILPGMDEDTVRTHARDALRRNLGDTPADNATITIQIMEGPGAGQTWDPSSVTSFSESTTTTMTDTDGDGVGDTPVTTSNRSLSTAKRSDAVKITVQINLADVAWIYGWFLPAGGIQSDAVVMMKQG